MKMSDTPPAILSATIYHLTREVVCVVMLTASIIIPNTKLNSDNVSVTQTKAAENGMLTFYGNT